MRGRGCNAGLILIIVVLVLPLALYTRYGPAETDPDRARLRAVDRETACLVSQWQRARAPRLLLVCTLRPCIGAEQVVYRSLSGALTGQPATCVQCRECQLRGDQ